LRKLRTINLSGSHLDHDVATFWTLPSLQEAILYKVSLPGAPVEILSKDDYRDNCLDRLRAHLADLTGDDAAVGDVKLMILGNGRVGKTQICRRLRYFLLIEDVAQRALSQFGKAAPTAHAHAHGGREAASSTIRADILWPCGRRDPQPMPWLRL
jgi:hypothetical protein